MIGVPPDQAYAMVTDISRMGEWSPETYRTEWLGGATGPAVGARFRGWNKHGLLRWSTRPKVTALEPGRVFEFDTGTTRWRYEFRDGPDGGAGASTELVESFETRGLPGYDFGLRLLRRDRSLQQGMEDTLQRIKAAAERPA